MNQTGSYSEKSCQNGRRRMQEIRMCFQTYFNMYGTMPSEYEMLEWLGTSYENEIPKYMNQLLAA